VGHVGAQLAQFGEPSGLCQLASLLLELVAGFEQPALAAVEQVLQQQVVASQQQYQHQHPSPTADAGAASARPLATRGPAAGGDPAP
jgi:hypothetical protein